MKVLYYPPLLTLLMLFTCDPAPQAETAPLAELLSPNVDTLPYPVYENFDAIAPLFEQQDDRTYVINFWATWCQPCVEEMPYFEQLAREMDDEIQLVMVSLDFQRDISTKLKRFVEERQLDLPVVALADADYDSWIDRVNPEWGGAIPVTVIYRGDERYFHTEKFVDYAELVEAVAEVYRP